MKVVAITSLSIYSAPAVITDTHVLTSRQDGSGVATLDWPEPILVPETDLETLRANLHAMVDDTINDALVQAQEIEEANAAAEDEDEYEFFDDDEDWDDDEDDEDF